MEKFKVTFYNPQTWETLSATVEGTSWGSAIMKARDVLSQCFSWPVSSIEEIYI